MAFNLLPDEVLHKILEFSGSRPSFAKIRPIIYDWAAVENLDDGVETLAKLSKCSRRINSMVEPMLYSSLMETKGDTEFLPFLLRSILVNPSLGKYVQKLSCFARRHTEDYLEILDMAMFTEDERNLAATRIRMDTSLTENEALEWINDFGKGHWDAVIAVILPLLPSLQQLNMAYSYSFDGDFDRIERLFSRAAGHQVKGVISAYALSSIQSITLHYAHHGDADGLQLRDIIHFMKLPSISSFEMDNLADGPDNQPSLGIILPEKHLAFKQSTINPGVLDAVLKCCHRLESFEYNYAGSTVGHSQVHPRRLGHSLSHLKSSLRKLKVLTGGPSSSHLEDLEQEQPIGKLTDFGILDTICAEGYIIMGEKQRYVNGSNVLPIRQLVDVLPQSLTHLELIDCKKEVTDQLRDLLGQLEVITPKLSTVRINLHEYGNNGSHPIDKTELEELQERFRESGVNLSFQSAKHEMVFDTENDDNKALLQQTLEYLLDVTKLFSKN